MTNSDYVLEVFKIFTNGYVGRTEAELLACIKLQIQLEAELLACIKLQIQLKNYKYENSVPGFHTLVFDSEARNIHIEFIVKKGIVTQTFILEKLGDKWEQVG